MRRIVISVVAIAFGLGALGACSSNSYDRSDFVKELEDEGMTSEQANCIADGVEDRLDIKELEDQNELTAEQETILGEITLGCLGLGDIPIQTE
jgi:hypothetical protein